jgi:hypothetical protein
MKAKKKKPTEKNTTLLRKKADKLWSKAVRSDWAGRCAVCGKEATEAHHLVPRQHYATRHDLMCGVALCTYDHIWNKHTAPHQNPSAWEKWLRDNHPSRAEWCQENDHPQFIGKKTADYYCSVIRRLQPYVEAEEFVAICGIKFAAWLEEQGDSE